MLGEIKNDGIYLSCMCSANLKISNILKNVNLKKNC